MLTRLTYIGATDTLSHIMMGQAIASYEALADPSPFVIERTWRSQPMRLPTATVL